MLKEGDVVQVSNTQGKGYLNNYGYCLKLYEKDSMPDANTDNTPDTNPDDLPKNEDLELVELSNQYLEVLEKPVPNNKKNNKEWIKTKIEEALKNKQSK